MKYYTEVYCLKCHWMEQTPSGEMHCGVCGVIEYTVMSLCADCWVISQGGGVSERLLWNSFHASAALGAGSWWKCGCSKETWPSSKVSSQVSGFLPWWTDRKCQALPGLYFTLFRLEQIIVDLKENDQCGAVEAVNISTGHFSFTWPVQAKERSNLSFKNTEASVFPHKMT